MTSNNQFNKVFIGDKCKVHDGIAMRNATVESVDTDNQTYTVIIDGLGTKISNIPFSIWRPVKSDDKEAKEKAMELVEKFKPATFSNGLNNIRAAKQCALICVDEILKTYSGKQSEEYLANNGGDVIYWQQVRHQIQSM